MSVVPGTFHKTSRLKELFGASRPKRRNRRNIERTGHGRLRSLRTLHPGRANNAQGAKMRCGSPAWRTTIRLTYGESAAYRFIRVLKCRIGAENPPLVHGVLSHSDSRLVLLTSQDVRFYSHMICPLCYIESWTLQKGAEPPIQELYSLPARNAGERSASGRRSARAVA